MTLDHHDKKRLSTQTVLFLLIILAPSTALVLLSARMIAQERELAENRSRVGREELGTRFGAALAAQLNAAARNAESTPEVMILARDGEEFLLPWERSRREGVMSEAGFAEEFLAGERAEFAAGEWGRALEAYRAALAQTAVAQRQAQARLAAARVLARSGARAEAAAEFGLVAALPLNLRDAADIPFAFYAASGLLPHGTSGGETLERLLDEAARSAHRLSPASLYLCRDLLDQLARELPEWRLRAEKRRHEIKGALERNEHWASVRESISQMPHLWNEPPAEGRGLVWRLHQGFLLASLRDGEEREVRVAGVDASQAVAEIVKRSEFEIFAGVAPRLVSGLDSSGVALGPEFPDVQIVLPPPVWAALAVRPQIELYGSLIVLVIGVTVYGAYLWNLNTRRELRLVQMRSDFVASVSHELKTPLTSIQMLTETLRRRELGSPERGEYLELILRETQRLGRLLKNVLDFSQVERGTKVYNLEAANLREIAADAARAIEQPMGEKRIDLRLQNELDLPVAADADALEQALLNLLWNAIKYSPAGSVIELQTARADAEAIVQVRDSGCGIHPRDHERIFERFYRAPEEHNRRIPGTGLGLALVKHVVESHGGRVSVQSAPGQGSTFTVSLPLEPADTTAEPK